MTVVRKAMDVSKNKRRRMTVVRKALDVSKNRDNKTQRICQVFSFTPSCLRLNTATSNFEMFFSKHLPMLRSQENDLTVLYKA
jgi:hypothetical protein